MGAEIEANGSAVSKWWQRDNIPAEWWRAVLGSPVAKAAGLKAETMAALAARESEQARQ